MIPKALLVTAKRDNAQAPSRQNATPHSRRAPAGVLTMP